MKKIIAFLLCFLCLVSCSSSNLNKDISFINESNTTKHFKLGETLGDTIVPSSFIYKENYSGFEYYTESLSYRYVFSKNPKLGNKEVLTYFYTCDPEATLFGIKVGESTHIAPSSSNKKNTKVTLYLQNYLTENGFKLNPHKKGTFQEIYFEGSSKYCWVCYESDTAFINYSYNFNSGKAELHKFQIGIL